jgi:hypothetical protein
VSPDGHEIAQLRKAVLPSTNSVFMPTHKRPLGYVSGPRTYQNKTFPGAGHASFANSPQITLLKGSLMTLLLNASTLDVDVR